MEALSRHMVFIGGLHRSGTTAIARALAAHPEVSGFVGTDAKEDEGQHLQDVYPPARSYGGAGRFGFSEAAHLTEGSALATPHSAERLMEQWGRHWDLSRPVLIEKSPPNLVMTRFLQSLFPDASFLIMVRHPAVVALSTGRWRRSSSVRTLLEHWVAAHETFASDATRLRRVRVIRYERLIRTPQRELDEVGRFLGLEGAIPPDSLERGRSDAYEQRWLELCTRGTPWHRRSFARTLDSLEPRVNRFGYSLHDLHAVGEFPVTGSGDA